MREFHLERFGGGVAPVKVASDRGDCCRGGGGGGALGSGM